MNRSKQRKGEKETQSSLISPEIAHLDHFFREGDEATEVMVRPSSLAICGYSEAGPHVLAGMFISGIDFY